MHLQKLSLSLSGYLNAVLIFLHMKEQSFNMDFVRAFAQNGGFSLVFVSLWCALIYRVYVLHVFHFVHCIPRVYVIPIFGFAGKQCFKQENIDPEMVCWEFLGLGVISLSNRSLYHFRVYFSPTCNATAGVEKNMLVGSAESKTRMQSVGSMLCQLSIVVHCCPLYPQGLCYPHC